MIEITSMETGYVVQVYNTNLELFAESRSRTIAHPARIQKCSWRRVGYSDWHVLTGNVFTGLAIGIGAQVTGFLGLNGTALVNQAVTEPVRGTWGEPAIWGLLTALHRFSDALLSLECYLAHDKELLGRSEIRQFGQYVDRCLMEIESAVFHSGEKPPEGILDTVSPFTMQELLDLDLPASFSAVLVRLEANLSTMFRMVSAL